MNMQLAEPLSATKGEIPEDALYEIVDGVKVEVPALAMLPGRVATEILLELGIYLRKNRGLGCVVCESIFHMPVTGNDRRPDVAFISAERLPLAESLKSDGDFPIAPDLAVEVMSPNDPSRGIEKKIKEYFKNGVREVWVVHPDDDEIKVYTAPRSARILGDGDILRSALFPGFEVAVETLFPKE